jgi:hypothetical protein
MSYKAYQFIDIQNRKENILIIDVEKNNNIVESIDKSIMGEKYTVYFIGSMIADKENMPDMIKQMIEDMIKDEKDKMNYEIATFEDNTAMDKYIEEIKMIEKKMNTLINESNN